MAALPIPTVYPSYNNTANYSGANSAVRSAGPVANVEQAAAVASAEREGRLGLSQFAFLKVPREVLFLQDDKGAKIKSNTVSSTTESDLDENRLLSKVEDAQIAVQGLGGEAGSDSERDAPEDEKDAPSSEEHAGFASVLGKGATVYQGVISASGAGLSGRNLSVLA